MPSHIRLGVVGWPVRHSRSPQMMGAALAATGLSDWRYQRLPLPPELVTETLRALPGAGFRGVNLTIPHKRVGLHVADLASESAAAIGAANTLIFTEEGGVEADNTDGPGFLAALPTSPHGRTALVLGAGGTAQAVVWALASAGAAEVRIWNRDPNRARALAGRFGATVAEVIKPADLLVHCTPVGMGDADQFKQLPLKADVLAMFGCVVDFVYGTVDTSLVGSARSRGVPVVDGFDLLVAQGALSFERFTGMPAPIDEMRAAARAR